LKRLHQIRKLQLRIVSFRTFLEIRKIEEIGIQDFEKQGGKSETKN